MDDFLVGTRQSAETGNSSIYSYAILDPIGFQQTYPLSYRSSGKFV
jgi:hypothetical protein